MREEPSPAERAFAANRARGRVALAFAARTRGTGRTALREEGALRMRFPGGCAGAREAVLINSAGGITGGDRFAVDIDLAEDARLIVTTAAAEKVYRSLGPDAEIDVTARLADGADLAWLPQETILFDRGRLRRTVDIVLAPGATLLFAETLVFGRTAMGEVVSEGTLIDRWRIRCGGRLVFADALRFDGAISGQLNETAVAAGRAALGTVLLVPGDDAMIAAVRGVGPALRGEVGISSWAGLALMRLVAADGAALRHDLTLVLAVLGRGLPRLWLN
jgi:urease accessory protein